MIRCEEALARLWEFLDGELEATSEDAVQSHLEMCSRCYPRYDFQKAYFELMSRVQKREAMSTQRRRQLFERILEEDAMSPGGNGTGRVV